METTNRNQIEDLNILAADFFSDLTDSILLFFPPVLNPDKLLWDSRSMNFMASDFDLFHYVSFT